VVDGTGAPRRRADVGVEGGRVAVVGDLAHAACGTELDASGLIVAPGFIDIHSHSDFTLLVDPRAQSAIAQGVTTELVGNCGHGCAPIADADAAKGNIYGYTPEFPISWRTTAGYLELLDRRRPAVNVLTLVPNGMLCRAVMGLEERAPRPDELRRMGALLAQGLEEGAVGFSVGLEYPIERCCTPDQVTELCTVCAKYDGLFAPHVRNREVRSIEAVQEALDTARAVGVRVHIPHVVPRRGGPQDADLQIYALVDRARRGGCDVSMDMHTRLHGLTNLAVALPGWALEGTSAELRGRLRDPDVRAALRGHESLITSFALGGWDRVSLLTSARRPDLIGRSFQDVADASGTTPFDAVLDVLDAEAEDPYFPLCLCESYIEPQLRAAYEHPACTAASDATTLCPDGPLSRATFHGAYTWASWFLRRHVREQPVFTIEEAVRKLTALPAARLKLSDRGVLRAGACADVVVFDADRVTDRGTLTRPNQLALGVVHVLVNGIVEMAGGAFTPERAGRVLRA
jgi:N-acyl-D-aspartate/D-glutamate deacylase